MQPPDRGGCWLPPTATTPGNVRQPMLGSSGLRHPQPGSGIASLGGPGVCECHDKIDVTQLFKARSDGAVRLNRVLESDQPLTDLPLVGQSWNSHRQRRKILDLGTHWMAMPRARR